jgi:hypothetical protein
MKSRSLASFYALGKRNKKKARRKKKEERIYDILFSSMGDNV